MKIIARPKGEGKTTECIHRAANNWLYFVCASHSDAIRIAKHAREIGREIPFPITFNEFIKGDYSSSINGFIFDDVDRMIRGLSRGVPIKIMTLTTKE